jgi:hypothetical protein
LEIKFIENTNSVCKDGRLVIPKPLQVRAVIWYHHYLQHPGHTRLEETMSARMYWKGMHTTIQSITRSCKTRQTNKRWKLKFGHLLPKPVISNLWECLCVNLIGPYTLNGKDNLQIDFLALTMINPASSWFKIVELPVVGILSDEYQWTNPLPQIPTKQSVPTSREVLPGYFGLPTWTPTLCSLIGPTIDKAQIPWLSYH